MIHGAHVLIQSKDAEADLAFIADVLGKPASVDAGGGWLIYALPPAEIAVHPSESNDVHSLYLMCDDIAEFRAAMAGKGIACSDVHEQRWGSLVQITLPGGGKLGVYEPKHPSPRAVASKPARKSSRKPAARKSAKKPVKRAGKKKPATTRRKRTRR